MIKKLLSAFVSMFIMTCAFGQSIGSWKVYSNYSTNHLEKVIDTKNMVYYLSGGYVFVYDKESGETIGYNRGNGLSDMNVTDMFRNYDRDYVMLFYQSGNIDLLYDDGNVVNMGDIAAASYVTDKTLNGVAFNGDDAYVATGFGIVKFNTSNHTVEESGIFNKNVSAISIAGDKVVINIDDELRYSPLDGRHNSIDLFTSLGNVGKLKDMAAISDNKFLYTSDTETEGIITADYTTNTLVKNYVYLYFNPTINRMGDKWIIGNRDNYVVIDSEGNNYPHKLPESIKKAGYDNNLSYNSIEDDGSLWFINPDGLGHYDGKSDKVDQIEIKPMGTYSNKGVWNIVPGSSSDNIYLMNRSESYGAYISVSRDLMSINVLKDGFVTDVTPDVKDVELTNSESGNLYPGFSIVEDPEEPGTLYVGTWFEGIYKFRDGKQVAKYDWRNMPLNQTYNCTAVSIDFDTSNNLWVYGYDFKENIFIGVLPSSKRKQSEVSKSDWINIKASDVGVFFTRDSRIMALKHSKNKNLVVVTSSDSPYKFLIYNTNGTIDSTSDDTYHVYNGFIDQDGKSFGPLAIFSVAEDKNGALWIGTTDGVIVIHNPSSMLGGNGTVERVKVPRNDGTQYADYLLSNRLVTAIAVDNANRKWLGTSSSGLYLVSEDGKEIISNFTSENTGIDIDEVSALACDPNGNSVYAGTRYGLLEYASDASPGADDYSDVYAYPNPVKPEYTGPITITGLMDGSLVKIADIAGNVFYQCKATGGTAVWDGCDGSGRRVKTGVYLVFASSGGSDGSSSNGAVTKIMVIN
ncbi:MAG: hypothetical protein NC248_05670 [Bacteroides sp.]|nr:hypothetical protein [Bacteroides sp.]MCM1390241.1 hypothetical protein [Bacteroides sp.]